MNQIIFGDLASQCFGESDQVVRHLLDACIDFFVGNLVASECFAGRENEPRNNDTTKIEHETIGVGHDRHVTRSAAGRAQKADNLVVPGAARQLDHVLGGGCDIIIIYGRSDQDPVRRLDRGAQFFGDRHAITFVRVAERQVHFADVDPGAIRFLLLQVRERYAPHAPAVAAGVTARADNEIFWHLVVSFTTENTKSAEEFFALSLCKIAGDTPPSQ